jgi:phosphoribosyl 1,2-cyclic phosphodiesterase
MFGFLFGEVAYLSDVNGIPERTHELIRGCGLLIIDMLRVQVDDVLVGSLHC